MYSSIRQVRLQRPTTHRKQMEENRNNKCSGTEDVVCSIVLFKRVNHMFGCLGIVGPVRNMQFFTVI